MSTRHPLSSRRAAVLLAAAAFGLAIVLSLPKSFSATTGYDVVLTTSAPGLDGDHVTAIVHEMMLLLGPEDLRVDVELMEDGTTHRFLATTPARSGTKAQRTVAALVATLTTSGCDAAVTVTPRTERVAGRVYGFLAERLERRLPNGTPDSNLEAEIRGRLLAAGFAQESVVVPVGDLMPDRSAEREIPRDTGQPSRELPEIVLGPGARSWTLRVTESNDFGARKLLLELTRDGRSSRVELASVDGLSRSALATELQSELDRAGFRARATVTGERITIEAR